MRRAMWVLVFGVVGCGRAPVPPVPSVEPTPSPDKTWVQVAPERATPAPFKAKVVAAPGPGLFVGQAVLVEWHGAYYPARVQQVVDPTHAEVRYDGYGAEWDEVVGPERLVTGRRLDGQVFSAPAQVRVPVPAAPPVGTRPYDFARAAVGDSVSVEWHGTWWDAHVHRVDGPASVTVNYDGWGHDWDESVGPARIVAR